MQTVPRDEMHEWTGKQTGISDWFTIDQERIDAFADVTEDHQWIHVDQSAAADGPFGTTVAHGFLTLSLLSNLASDAMVVPAGAVMYLNYGSDKVRFLSPVPSGARIRAVGVLKAVTEKSPERTLVTTTVTVEIEGHETPALVADLLTLAIVE
ncbi:MAG: MaoC family dehydratase [Acidimicrobiia bacterium]